MMNGKVRHVIYIDGERSAGQRRKHHHTTREAIGASCFDFTSPFIDANLSSIERAGDARAGLRKASMDPKSSALNDCQASQCRGAEEAHDRCLSTTFQERTNQRDDR